jgi:outer membrane lipoprotein carrier protein
MRRLICVVLLSFVAGLARAEPVESLRHFFSDVQTFQAKFQQVVLDEALNPIQESSGVLSIERPNKFRWAYETPYKQEIVGDGTNIWVYDKELQQVTKRPLAGGLGYTPAVLLSGRGRLEDTFAVKPLGTQGSLEWAELKPKSKDGGFEVIRIGFEQGKLRTLEMVDSFGNTTRVTLQGATENSKIDPSRFQFTPPKGVDLIE